ATMSTGADTPRTLSDLATPTARELAKNAPQVHEIVRDSKASNVRVFGSVARGEDNDASDIDLMVDLDPDADLVDLSMMSHRLRQLLGREVDVVPADQLRPAVDETAGTGAVAL
ncbi:MAG: nucleotidyltransferase family protein, partial [Nocardioidaceae bacterium]